MIALGFLHPVDASRKEIGGHGAAVVREAVAEPELDGVGIADPFNLRTHAPSFERITILIGGHRPSSFFKLSMESLGCTILG